MKASELSKFIYPSNGLYNHCCDYLDMTLVNLNKMPKFYKKDFNFEFDYDRYLLECNEEIVNFRKTIKELKNSIDNLTNDYDNLSYELTDIINGLDEIKINKRNAIIK